jgi:hypothetical protein
MLDAVELAMKEAARLRKLEAKCRQRALSEPARKWYWLAQAAKYLVQADQEIAFHFDEGNTTDTPEVKLAPWSNGGDARRSMEPFATSEQLDAFYRPEERPRDRRQTRSTVS